MRDGNLPMISLLVFGESIFLADGSDAGFPISILLFDPGVGLFHSIGKRRGRLPIEDLLDKCVVAVPAGHSDRRVQFVFTLEFQTADLLDQANQIIDRNQLA